jgi:hypothetical protein
MGMSKEKGHQWRRGRSSRHLATASCDLLITPGMNLSLDPHDALRAERDLLGESASRDTAVNLGAGQAGDRLNVLGGVMLVGLAIVCASLGGFGNRRWQCWRVVIGESLQLQKSVLQLQLQSGFRGLRFSQFTVGLREHFLYVALAEAAKSKPVFNFLRKRGLVTLLDIIACRQLNKCCNYEGI